jgi:transposase
LTSQAARDFDIHENLFWKWKQRHRDDTLHIFPDKGRLKPEEEEMKRLRRELADIKEEHDNLRKNCIAILPIRRTKRDVKATGM